MHQALARASGRRTASGPPSSRITTSFVRAEGKSEEIPLSKDGKEGLAYGRLSWSPDSKTLVAFRIEPGERKEVYLIQSSPPGGGRAKLQDAALRAARRQVHRLRAEPLRRRREEAIRPEVDRIDFGSPGSAGTRTAGISPMRRTTEGISGSG